MTVPTVRELLDSSAAKYGCAPFIKYIQDGVVCEKSFFDIRDDSKAVCRFLRDLAPERAHIAIIGKTSYAYLEHLTGILLSGHVAVPFAPEISVREAAMLFEKADISVLLYERDFADKAAALTECCPALRHTVCIDDPDARQARRTRYGDDSPFAALSEFAVDPDACIAIIFTSGTTGERKGVMLSTVSLVGNILYRDYCDEIFNAHDVALSVLPMHHVYCFSGDFLKNLKDGLQVCLNGNMKDLLQNLQIFQPKVMRVVPLIARSLLQRVRMIRRRDPALSARQAAEQVFGKNIRWLISGGAYLPAELIGEYDELGIFLRQGYGMTEAGCRISVPDETARPESVGRVIDLCRVRIRDGEIQVHTPTVMCGYYRDEAATAAMFTADGWLKTGDLGYVTADRELFITGRVKNLIILSGGENVSPEAIEKKFAEIPLVREILVYAHADRIVADIYPDSDYAAANDIADIPTALDALVEQMNRCAKSAHRIDRIHVCDQPLPKTASGKIRRHHTVLEGSAL